MDASIISALSALTGSAVGGFTSVLANWLNQRNQIRAQWVSHEKNHRSGPLQGFHRRSVKMLHRCAPAR
jgi:hypothetical protein